MLDDGQSAGGSQERRPRREIEAAGSVTSRTYDIDGTPASIGRRVWRYSHVSHAPRKSSDFLYGFTLDAQGNQEGSGQGLLDGPICQFPQERFGLGFRQ